MTFFTSNIRKSNIPTIIVNGYGKTSSTRLGETNDEELQRLTSSWNLVFADDKWRIVHPFMVCNATTNMGLRSAVDHILQKVFNQNFIFPDPEVFSCRYIPLETQANHQLTKYISFDQWKRQPIIYPAFCKFDCRLRPSFNEKYICQVENGTATFFLDMAKERASEDVGVPFELFLLDDDKNENKNAAVRVHDTCWRKVRTFWLWNQNTKEWNLRI